MGKEKKKKKVEEEEIKEEEEEEKATKLRLKRNEKSWRIMKRSDPK